MTSQPPAAASAPAMQATAEAAAAWHEIEPLLDQVLDIAVAVDDRRSRMQVLTLLLHELTQTQVTVPDAEGTVRTRPSLRTRAMRARVRDFYEGRTERMSLSAIAEACGMTRAAVQTALRRAGDPPAA